MLPTGAARLFKAIHDAPPPAMTAEEAADWLDRLDLVLRMLGTREAFVVRQRYLREPPRTLDELADLLLVSRSRVGQLGKRAIGKLRHPSRRGHLQPKGDVVDALHSAAISWALGSGTLQPAVPVVPTDVRDRLLLSLSDVEMSVRAFNCLSTVGLTLVGDLVQKTETDLLRIPYFGRKSLREVKALLRALDLSLGMKVPGWARMKATRVWRMAGTPGDGHDEERQR